MTADLHRFLDFEYGGDDALRALLDGGADVQARRGLLDETPLHVAARRRRPVAVAIMLERGADPDARNGGGKTAYVHALCRHSDDIVAVFGARGAVALTDADRLPDNARLLVAAGAPLEVVDDTHHATPLGWAVHGSRYSGGADGAQDAYVAIVELLLAAGAIVRDRLRSALRRG